ncbi:MAG: tetratricopeptide repeat protein [Betaproteobacteria bacterium]|nr:MAG: tetratricopeptide repeat protein [Betaproteobacteria bacterium]
MKRWALYLAICVVAGVSGLTYGAGGDGGGGGGGSGDGVKHDASYDAGVAAVEKQDWKRAIALFQNSLRWDRFNADAHNWLGFSYRNAGDMKRAFEEYEEALRLDPQHKGAHEYVGEAYVIANNIPKAEEHLAALEKLCGRSCPEYHELEETIEKAKKRG